MGDELAQIMLVNLTPHDITVRRGWDCWPESTQDLTIPASGLVARATMVSEYVMDVNGCSVFRTRFVKVEGDDLPPPRAGVMYIVSSIVAQLYSERDDLLAPDTSPESAIRNDAGQIVAVRYFRTFSQKGGE
jgi:hypothetical protein